MRQTFKKSAIAFALASSALTAQAEDYTTGTMRGILQDTAGQPVTNASVTITSNKGVKRNTTSDESGQIRVPQLPIGNYTVTISQAGYETFVADNVPIKLGAAADFTFTLKSMSSTIEEVYVTGVRQGSWDFNTTTTGLTVDVGEMFATTAIGRDAASIALLAPGTGLGDTSFSTGMYGNSGSAVAIGGASVAENAYYVNGLNVTNFRTFVGGSTIPFEFYDQIEVKTGGYQAEFGRSTGGVINAVTKSGSDEFHFGINGYIEPNSLYETSPDTYTNANHLDERSTQDYNVWASGPIIKDKLYFFGLYNPRKIETLNCGGGDCVEQTKDDPFYGLKLDFIPFEGHRLEYMYFSDDQDTNEKNWSWSDDATAAVGDTAAIKQVTMSDAKANALSPSTYTNGGSNWNIKYTAAVTDWFTLSAMYGENEYARQNYSAIDTAYMYDNATGARIGDWAVSSFQLGEDKREATRIDADFYFEAMGDHHVRIGWDNEDLFASEQTRYSGDTRAALYDCSDCSPAANGMRWQYRQYQNYGAFKTTQSAFYIQDSWQILDNLTLNLGLRNETFENSNVDGDVFLKMDNQLAFRGGFSWDPKSDGSMRVYGSYGRYYLPVATNTNIRLAGSEIYYRQYLEAVDADMDGNPDIANGQPVFGPELGSKYYYSDGTIGFAEAQSAEGLDPMYQDEWILGFEQQLGDEWTLGVRYIKRDLKSTIEDAAIDAAVMNWAEANGYGNDPALDSYSGFHQYVLINPGQSVRVAALEDFGNDGVVDWMDLSAEDLGYPSASRTYKAVDLTLEREWDGEWYVSANYTWSKNEGNYEGSVKSDIGQDDAGLTQDFDQPGLVDGAYGPLPNDRRHRLKLRGAYALNDVLTVAASLNMESPRKFGCIGEHPTDYFAWAYGAASWYCGGEQTPRGSQMQSDWIRTVDFSLSYQPKLDISGDLVFRVDVFNVFDADAVVDRYEEGEYGYESWNTAWEGEDPGTYYEAGADPLYGEPTRFQSPRRVRLGFSYNY